MNENQTEVIASGKSGILEKISFAILFVFSFLVPIFFVPASFISTQFGTSLLFAISIILTTLLMIAFALGTGSMRLPSEKKYLLWIYTFVPFIYILSGLSNGFSRLTFLGYTFDISTVGFIILSFIYMFFVSTLFGDKNRILYSYFAFMVSAMVLSAYLLSRILFGSDFLSFGIFNTLIATPIGGWNNVGIFFGIGVILSLLTYQMLSVSRLIKVLLSIALVLSLFFLSFVNFRIIWMIISVCSLLFIVYGIWTRRQSEPKPSSLKSKLMQLPLYPSLVFIISSIFIVWGSFLSGYFSNHFNLANLDVRPSLATTMDIAKNTLQNRPLFGSGPGTFINQWLSYKPVEIITTIFWNTDFNYGIGLLPTFLVTTGLFGILSWIIFFVFYIYLALKSLFTKNADDFTQYLVVSSFFVSLYLWIMSWVYVPSAVILILTFFFTGLFFASAYLAGVFPMSVYLFSKTPKAGFVSSLVLIALLFSVGALGFGLFGNSKSLWFFQKSSYALNTDKDIVASENYMNKAISTMPYDVYYRSLAEIEIAKVQAINNQLQSAGISKSDVDNLNTQVIQAATLAINAGLSARNADNSNYLNWIELGRAYQSIVPNKISGAYQLAVSSYNEAMRYNPQNPGIYLLLAQLDVDQNNLDEAKQYAMAAIKAKQDYLDAYYVLSQIEVAQKDLKSAIEAVTAATILSPNDSALFFQLGVLQFNNGDFNGAIASLSKSLSLSPQYANAQYFLGLSYEANKQHSQAISQFQILAKSNPDNVQVSNILKALIAGKSIFTNSQTSNKSTIKNGLPVQEKQQ
jgi:tetratricopeptide (TPR) repeat protein